MKITHCKLKKSIQRKLLEFFVAEVTSRSAADILGIQPNSAILFYHKIRKVIDDHLSLEADEIFEGKIELDESYFGGHHKGKRGRGVVGKVAVFGILKWQGKVLTVVVENTKSETLLPVIKRKIKPDSWVYTNTYVNFTMSELTISRYLPSEKITLMGLKILGAKLSECFENILE